MAVFKCKMCGGSLEVTEGMTVCECEYCGTKQTIPKSHDDVLTNNFNRANNLRMKNEFDKAQELYEKIVSANPTEAEAYWGIVLCKYGIEYVEDPTTLKKIPTCHRTQYESVVSDVDYLSAIENADAGQKELFEKEAAEIDKLQKNILEIVHKEKPFDVFICYKETDENGKRTSDSVIANDIYYQLTQEGFKVFYAAITLEDKLGQEYEPYIFAALNSAKVMLVIGSDPEYFNAVWVKNEWSRYLKLMKNDRSKLLIPCYKDMDAYDLPEEFAHLQAQDMSKIGFINDVIRGIRKVLSKEKTSESKAETKTVIKSSSGNVENLLKRGNIALEDGKWNDAKGYFDQVLNEDVEEHRAYIGFLCAEYGIANEQMLVQVNDDFTQSEYYQKACRFGGEEVKNRLYGYYLQSRYNHASYVLSEAKTTKDCIAAKEIFEWLGEYSDAQKKAEDCEEKRKSIIYSQAEEIMKIAVNNDSFTQAAKLYESLGGYHDSEKKAEQCRNKAKAFIEKVTQEKKQGIYDNALKAIKDKDSYSESDIKLLENSIKDLKALGDFKDSKEQIKNCEDKISEIEDYLEKEKAAQARARKKKKKITAIVSGSVVAVAAVVIVFVTVILPLMKYNDAKKLLDDGKYDEAVEAFEKMKDYKYSEEMIIEAKFRKAVAFSENGNYDEAIEAFEELDGYKDSTIQIAKCKTAINDGKYNTALNLYNSGKYDEAITAFNALNGYKDSTIQIAKCKTAINDGKYNTALNLYNSGKYDEAITAYTVLDGYKDSAEKAASCLFLKQKPGLTNISVGSTIKFGFYEQDNNTSNGKEEIEWKVLAVEGNKALVISQYALECLRFNSTYTDTTWEKCTLRTWLNGTFYNTAFGSDHQKMIIKSTVTAAKNPSYNTSPGNNTTDNVFLLSITEVNKYFSSNSRQCQGTAYCYAEGAYKAGNGNCWWWLRSPGSNSNYAACVNSGASVINGGSYVHNDRGAVRPALWINLK
ncbi:DUF6273 domain-containing protein [Ruminococcus sp. FC2018]|uniref:DUF6273 domain-containing protein n=1 Tax=Ruminococcus sp. FC2018 TaxID=1410617 RepID=UPI00055FC18F|nr:DUF6273 domain-containing protein [Ruminococcus sp. FC2018]